MKSLFGLAATVALISSCASAPVPREVTRVAVYGQSQDKVWEAVIEIFSSLTYPIANLERDSGLIVTDWMIVPPGSGYLDCGNPGFGTTSDPSGKFNVFVREAPTGIAVTINTAWRAVRHDLGGGWSTVSCVSTGGFEQRFHGMLREALSENE